MIHLIFSADYRFQVIAILDTPKTNSEAWKVVNQMEKDNHFKNTYKVEHYDLVSFKNLSDANKWIMQQVADSRI